MRNYRLYLKDILEAMVAAQSFVEGMDFDAFIADDKTVSAVVRKLEIIGEALRMFQTLFGKSTHRCLGGTWQACGTGSFTYTLMLTTL